METTGPGVACCTNSVAAVSGQVRMVVVGKLQIDQSMTMSIMSLGAKDLAN